MTAKEYLSRARGIETEVEQLRRLKSRAWEKATGNTVPPSQAPAHTSGQHDPIAAYARYAEKLEARTAELLDIQRDIIQTIERVEDSRYRQLLQARYLEGQTWEQIAVAMGYSWRQILRMHGDALRQAEDVIECHTRPEL